MLVCLCFEQTPLCGMIYCTVPERWLTHQGPLFGDICVQAPYCTQTNTSCPHRALCKALQLVLQLVWFGFVEPGGIAQLAVLEL